MKEQSLLFGTQCEINLFTFILFLFVQPRKCKRMCLGLSTFEDKFLTILNLWFFIMNFRPVAASQKCHSLMTRCVHIVCSKSGTNCYPVSRLMRPTDSQQVVPTSLISSARNKLTSWWRQARSNMLQTACISLVGTTCSEFVTVISLVTRW